MSIPPDRGWEATGKVYSITLGEGAEYIVSCPAEAESGKVTVIRSVLLSDGEELRITVNGEPAGRAIDNDHVFWFFMPEGEALLEAEILSPDETVS